MVCSSSAQVALVSDVDAMDKLGRDEGSSDAAARLKLMTVHASKGLEFDGCFVVGVEDGLLPHYYSLDVCIHTAAARIAYAHH